MQHPNEMEPPMKIALIGATGNAGSRILAELSRRGHAVTAIARNPQKVPALPGVTALRADVDDVAGSPLPSWPRRRDQFGAFHGERSEQTDRGRAGSPSPPLFRGWGRRQPRGRARCEADRYPAIS